MKRITIRSSLLFILFLFILGCASDDIPTTPTDPPSWAPSYILEGWILGSSEKSTDMEYILTYTDANNYTVELILGDNTGFDMKQICQIFRPSRITAKVFTRCEEREGFIVSEWYDRWDRVYVQIADSNQYGVMYSGKNKLDADELLKIAKSMQ